MKDIKVGDLVQVRAEDDGIVYAIGIYLGIKKTWKEWHSVHVVHPWQLANDFKVAQLYDEPYWKLEVINANR
jgi:hypothetical protein